MLNTAIGGPSVRPPQPPGVAELGYGNSGKWAESTGPDRYRRGLYIHFQRTAPYPQLMNFDAPDSNVACTRRSRSNTPLQALNLLNDPVFFEAAQALAFRVLRSEASPATSRRLARAFRMALEPRSRIRRRTGDDFGNERQNPRKLDADAPEPTEAAAWVAAGRVLMNIDEFIVRE